MKRSDQKADNLEAEGTRLPAKELALARLTAAQADLIATAKKTLPTELFAEWTQRAQERLGAVDFRKRPLLHALGDNTRVYRRLLTLAQWDLMDLTVPHPLRLSPGLDRLLRSLPLGLFVGECCARMEYLTNGPPEDAAVAAAFGEIFSPGEVQEAVQRLEDRRLLVRYAVKARRVCFLVFSRQVSAEFTQALLRHVRPEVLSFPLTASFPPASLTEKDASAANSTPA